MTRRKGSQDPCREYIWCTREIRYHIGNSRLGETTRERGLFADEVPNHRSSLSTLGPFSPH